MIAVTIVDNPAISKKLVELHGGKIWAESKYGEGTKFIFTLPLVDKNEG